MRIQENIGLKWSHITPVEADSLMTKETRRVKYKGSSLMNFVTNKATELPKLTCSFLKPSQLTGVRLTNEALKTFSKTAIHQFHLSY